MLDATLCTVGEKKKQSMIAQGPPVFRSEIHLRLQCNLVLDKQDWNLSV